MLIHILPIMTSRIFVIIVSSLLKPLHCDINIFGCAYPFFITISNTELTISITSLSSLKKPLERFDTIAQSIFLFII